MADPSPAAGKKYHTVFISGTYTDLQEEREEVLACLLGLEAIPTGMELFGASARPSWDVIKSTIDVCDYYVLIIGGRYGSRVPKDIREDVGGDISYTEAEVSYATTRGLPRLVFVHANRDGLPSNRTSTKPADVKALDRFIGRATADVNLAKYTDPKSLALELAKAWPKLLTESPDQDGFGEQPIPSTQTQASSLPSRHSLRRSERSTWSSTTGPSCATRRCNSGVS